MIFDEINIIIVRVIGIIYEVNERNWLSRPLKNENDTIENIAKFFGVQNEFLTYRKYIQRSSFHIDANTHFDML